MTINFNLIFIKIKFPNPNNYPNISNSRVLRRNKSTITTKDLNILIN
jgi:hypothetical protein